MPDRSAALLALTTAAAKLARTCAAIAREQIVVEPDPPTLASELHHAFGAGAAVPADFEKLLRRMK